MLVEGFRQMVHLTGVDVAPHLAEHVWPVDWSSGARWCGPVLGAPCCREEMRGCPASEHWEARVAPLFHAVSPTGGDTALHLSERDEHVGEVELVAVSLVA